MPRAASPGIERGMVAPKGFWQSPWQIYQAYNRGWHKYEREDIDLEEFKKRKIISYFNREPSMVLESDYDRMFHAVDDFDPKAKIKAVRNKISEEENERLIPVVTSHVYGHLSTNLEGKKWISHKRINVMSEMYRRFYPNLKPTKKLPRGHNLEHL